MVEVVKKNLKSKRISINSTPSHLATVLPNKKGYKISKI